jgi:hypothetical protein
VKSGAEVASSASAVTAWTYGGNDGKGFTACEYSPKYLWRTSEAPKSPTFEFFAFQSKPWPGARSGTQLINGFGKTNPRYCQLVKFDYTFGELPMVFFCDAVQL